MVLDDPYFDAQWLRTAGHSGSGGAELGECLAVDAIIERGLVFRPDWEAVVTQVVEAAVRRPEVDPEVLRA
jgi:hypothetical protein